MKKLIILTLVLILLGSTNPAKAAPQMITFVAGVELSNINGDNPLCGALIPSKPYVPLFCVGQVGDGWQISANTGTFEVAWITDLSTDRTYGSVSVLIDGNLVYTVNQSDCDSSCPDRFYPVYYVIDFILPVGSHTIQVLKNNDDPQPINLEYIGYYYNPFQAFIPLMR